MGWPEHFYKGRQQTQNSEGFRQHANSLSARAMQLSIYGSMVNIRRRFRSYPGSNSIKPLHSVSYPTIPTHHGRPLVSVRSEGSASVRKKLEGRKFTGEITRTPLQSTVSKESHVLEDSSDEDEVIVRIDSPSRLSFRQGS
ncbi:hypothetical protein TIFTF001_051867 [Ficus carica]|uniref:Uncharacterized protein n=1 Tax=Ficus carica TaxID=3494 RepID=A0AA88JGS6_FICCA|nr:hypothetical protein TIFTF001_051867 [Ficus carica]